MRVVSLLDRLPSSLRSTRGPNPARLKTQSTVFVAMLRQSSGTQAILETREELECPITHQLMGDPVVAEDGHTYERAAIEHWISTQEREGGDDGAAPSVRSPITNAELLHRGLTPNHALRKLIDAHRARLGTQLLRVMEEANAGASAADEATILAACQQCALLLERGASSGARDERGRTAIMIAVSAGWLSLVRLMLAHGASVTDSDEAGQHAADFAAELGSELGASEMQALVTNAKREEEARRVAAQEARRVTEGLRRRAQRQQQVRNRLQMLGHVAGAGGQVGQGGYAPGMCAAQGFFPSLCAMLMSGAVQREQQGVEGGGADSEQRGRAQPGGGEIPGGGGGIRPDRRAQIVRFAAAIVANHTEGLRLRVTAVSRILIVLSVLLMFMRV